MENQKKIQKVDGDGVTYPAHQCTYKGKELDYAIAYKDMPKLYNYLHTDFKPKPDDVWLLSYPRSGCHWVHEIISILTSGKLEPMKQYKDSNMAEIVRDFSSVVEEIPSPRIINTHTPPKFLPKPLLDTSKIICIVRNPKSVAVSYYKFISGLKFAEYDGEFKGFLKSFTRELYSFEGSWFQYNKELWDGLHDMENVHFVFYEKMKINTIEEIQELALFLGLDRDKEFCESVAELTSFESMKKGIGKVNIDNAKLATMWKSGERQLFRKGIIDDWKNYFTVAQNEKYDQQYHEAMRGHDELAKNIQFE